jgi:GABA(A) receptor-associated protein
MAEMSMKDGEFDRIKSKFPDKIPVFITKSKSSKDIPELRKQKFLVPTTFTMSELILTIRRSILLRPEQALFVFINNAIPNTSATMTEIYHHHKSPDGILRMEYASENTFGFTSYDDDD